MMGRSLVLRDWVFVWFVAWLSAAPVRAVSTSYWKHTSEADFAAGKMDAVVASNLGDLKLSRAVRSVLEPDARVSAVHALAQTPDGVVYAATGPQGILLRIDGQNVTTAHNFGDNVNLFSLLVDRRGRLLVGTGGERGEVYRFDDPAAAPTRIFSADGVQFVWAMHQAEDDTLYVATGPSGKLFAISPDGQVRLFYDSGENNLLCIAARDDVLYVGTDPNGLAIRINRKTGEVFVLYDAAESEISALALDENGNLLAATGQASPDEAVESAAMADQKGRPEVSAGGVPIQAAPPETPTPPQLPEPAPGEPRPIPKFSLFDDNTETVPAALPHTETAATAPARSAAAVAPAENGNAIYRIDPEGFVTEIYRGPVAIFSLLAQNGAVLAGTGSDGKLVQVDPAAEETLVLAKVDSRQILALLAGKDGAVYLGCSNRGDINVMTRGYAAEGTYTSPVLDAGQIARFGKIRLQGTLPEGTSAKISTRSGNASEPDSSGWSPWSPPVDVAQFVPITSPPARFFQYQLSMSTTDPAQSPVVGEVEVAYQLPNLPPNVSAVRIVAGDASSPDTRARHTISWEATDPNADTLVYSLQFRTAGGGEWITLKDKLTAEAWEWDTRTVADGRYELRVTASDALANPKGSGRSASRISDPVLVDNTPPAIGDAQVTIRDRDATIRLTVVDRTGTVARLEYTVDGNADWQAVLPSDTIADSPSEAYEFTLAGLSPGTHQVGVRATDSAGNQAYATLVAKIEK